MGIFKLLFFLSIGMLLFVFIPVKTLTGGLSYSQYDDRSVLGTAGISASLSANLTLKPQDNLYVTPVVILEIVDINSLKVLLNDGMQTVDLIGIKIPTDTSRKRYEKCNGETIESAIQRLALGKKAFMLDDANYIYEDVPKKYIFLEDVTFLNEVLIGKGLTNAVDNETFMYSNEFEQVRLLAEEKSLGVWDADCEPLPTPTAIKSAKVKPSPTPTKPPYLYAKLIESPTPTLEPSPTPTTSTSSNHQAAQVVSNNKPTSLNPEILFALINNHRQGIGKPAFEKDERLCSLARERGPELYDEIFVTHNVHAGLTNRNLPYWITENMAHYDSEEQVFNWWMGSTVHRRAIEGDHKYSCGECYGNSCAQLFTSFTPK